MQIPILEGFSLVGGTALALKYGHRKSIDFQLQFRRDFGAFCLIENVKIDLVNHPRSLIRNLEIIDGIRMYSNEDIAAMKINAILGRGRKKDFWDIYELLQHYSLSQIIEFYKEKFPKQELLIGIPYALTYFDDAEDSEEPVSLKGQTWDTIKTDIKRKVSDFLR